MNLADPRLGLIDAINERLARTGLGKGRVDLALEAGERNVGITVNEYETLLMQHDLVEVLRNPLRFALAELEHFCAAPFGQAYPGQQPHEVTVAHPLSCEERGQA